MIRGSAFAPLQRSHRSGGFSLIELLVVVAIIALLAAIGIPQFASYRSRAIDAQMKSDLRNAAVAMESYYTKRSIYPASVSEIAGYGFQPTNGVTLSLVIVSPTSYTLSAAKPGGTQANYTFDSVSGVIQ
jgi:prepilin-type N-terminal cleavage/methylation domain-containing protein